MMGMRSFTEKDEGLLSPHGDVGEPIAPCAQQGAEHDVCLSVSSDVTADFPIGPAELDAIETFFGDLLDIVLGGSKNPAETLHRHKLVR